MSTPMLDIAAKVVGELLSRRVIGTAILSTGDAIVARFYLDGHEPVIAKVYQDRHGYRAARELHVHKLVHATGDLRVAELLAVSVSPPMLVFADQGLRELGETQANPTVLGEVLRRFHGVRSRGVLPPVGQARFRSASEQIRQLIEEFTEPVPASLYRAADVAGDAPLVMCHGDLHPSNVLVAPDNELVVVDFELTTLGPAEFDLARTAVLCDWLNAEDLNRLLEGYAGRVSFDVVAAMAVAHAHAGLLNAQHEHRDLAPLQVRVTAARSLTSPNLERV